MNTTTPPEPDNGNDEDPPEATLAGELMLMGFDTALEYVYQRSFTSLAAELEDVRENVYGSRSPYDPGNPGPRAFWHEKEENPDLSVVDGGPGDQHR